MNARRTAELLDTVSRILRELPGDIQVLGVNIDINIVTDRCGGGILLEGGITALSDFYGKEIKSDRRPGSQSNKYSITVDGIELYTLKKVAGKG